MQFFSGLDHLVFEVTLSVLTFLLVNLFDPVADSTNSPILWNPKQHRRSKKSCNVADSAANLILACCGFRLQCTECTVWPRNDLFIVPTFDTKVTEYLCSGWVFFLQTNFDF